MGEIFPGIQLLIFKFWWGIGRNSNTSSSTGVIQRVLTEDGLAGSTSVNVKASEDSPRYEVCFMQLLPMRGGIVAIGIQC